MTDEIQTQLAAAVASRLQLDDTVTATERDALVAETLDVLSKRIVVDLLPVLSEEDRFVLLDMLADEELSDDEVDTFLRTAMTRYGDAVAASIDGFFMEMDEALKVEG